MRLTGLAERLARCRAGCERPREGAAAAAAAGVRWRSVGDPPLLQSQHQPHQQERGAQQNGHRPEPATCAGVAGGIPPQGSAGACGGWREGLAAGTAPHVCMWMCGCTGRCGPELRCVLARRVFAEVGKTVSRVRRRFRGLVVLLTRNEGGRHQRQSCSHMRYIGAGGGPNPARGQRELPPGGTQGGPPQWRGHSDVSSQDFSLFRAHHNPPPSRLRP